MFGTWWARLRTSKDYTPQHAVEEQPPEPLDHTGPATRYLSRTGCWSENAVREYPTIRASVPAPNQRPWPSARP